MQASAAALWINTVFAGFDQSIITAVHNLYLWAGDFFTPFFEFISFLGHDGIILVLLSIALMLFKKTRRFGTAMLFGVAIGAIFTNCILKVLIARPRLMRTRTAFSISSGCWSGRTSRVTRVSPPGTPQPPLRR